MSSIIPPTSITPVRCPAKGCPWAAHGIPDKYTEARAWHLAAHRAEEHGKPLTAEQIAYGQSKGYRMPETQDATTPAPLSPEREAEWRAYADAATDGPWGTHRDLHGTYTIHTRPRITPTGLESDGHIATLTADGTDAETYATARLMAAAPEAVRALLAELDAERARVAELERGTATPDQPLITPSRCPYDCGHEIAEHSEYGCADGCECEWTPTSATTLTAGGPICTLAAARAAGLDIAPAPAELSAMAETIVATAGGAPTPEVDLARAVPLMTRCIQQLRSRVAELEQQAAAATEYRVPVPDGPALYVLRALGGTGWAVFEPRARREGRRAWTRDGWQLLAILAGSEVHCWPDATTALAEARKALAVKDVAGVEPDTTLQPLTDYDDGLGPVWPQNQAGESR